MENFAEALFIGILGGITASVIIAFALTIFQKIVVPWIKVLYFDGLDIEGEWEGIAMSEGGMKLHNNLNVTQKGSTLSGSYILNYTREDGTNRSLALKVTGLLQTNHVLLSFSPKSSKNNHLGSMLFKVRDGGESLEGSLVYVRRNGEIGLINEFIFKRRILK